MENKLTLSEWWVQNKRWVWPTLLFIFGLLGGNVDRANDFIPTSPDVNQTNKRLDDVEGTLNTLVKAVGAHETKLESCCQSVKAEDTKYRE